MSKMDDMRALREARYEASKPPADKPTAAPKAQRQVTNPAERAEAVPDPSEAGLCGHRAISGRTCTREKGHAAKSHRYA